MSRSVASFPGPVVSGRSGMVLGQSLRGALAASTSTWLHWLTLAVMVVSTAQLEAANRRGVLLNFSAQWCSPCQEMSPIVKDLKGQGLPIEKIDIDAQPEIARRYSITSIPAFVLIVDGEEVDRRMGRCSEQELRELMARIPRDQPATSETLVSSPRDAAVSDFTGVATNGPVSNGSTRLGAPGHWPTASEVAAEEASHAATGEVPARQVAATTTTPGARPSLFPSLFPRRHGAASAAAERPLVVRGNSPEGDATANLNETSRAASVRLRIKERVNKDGRESLLLHFGSGTIIESSAERATVLTSSHLLEAARAGRAVVEVDVFLPGAPGRMRSATYPAEVVAHDAEADVGLVAILTESELPVAPLHNGVTPATKGEKLASWGCGGGDVPSIEFVRVTALNHYDGPETIECSSAPMEGRSGGGLFNQAGELVGVCIGGNAAQKVGAYSALPPIVRLLQTSGYEALARRATPRTEGTQSRGNLQLASTNPVQFQDAMVSPGAMDGDVQLASEALGSAPDAEIVVIVRSKDSSAPSRVIVVHTATPKLRNYLLGEESPETPGQASELVSAFRAPRAE